MPPRSLPAVLARSISIALLAATTLAGPASASTLYAIGGNFGPTGGNSGLYTLDSSTGNLTWVAGLHTAGSTDNTLYTGGLAYDPYLDRLYGLGCDSTSRSCLFEIDRSNGLMVRLGYCYPPNDVSFCSGGLAFDVSTGRLFAVGDLGQFPYQRTSLVELDPSNGVASVIGINGPAGTYLAGLGCDPRTGILYANGFEGFNQVSGLFTLDKNTGWGTRVGFHGLSLGRQMNYSGLAVDLVAGDMFGFGSKSGSLNSLYRVSQSTGAVTEVGALSPNGLGVDGALTYVGTDVLAAGPRDATLAPLRAWPNPSRGSVAFAFGLAASGDVSLVVFDLAGRRMATLTAAGLPAGSHVLRWDGSGARGGRLPAGLYFARLRLDGAEAGRATVLLAR